MQLRRGSVLHDLENAVLAKELENIAGLQVHVTMIGPDGKAEAGEDNGGVWRDALSEYWSSFYEEQTTGLGFKIPSLSTCTDKYRWQAISKIIAVGFYTESYLPIIMLLTCK